jgi:peptidoglycan LD-endopeptidase CwlK
MASRRLTDLSPDAYKMAELLVCALDKAEFPYVVSCTLRDRKEQAALYAQGRNPLPVVQTMRRAVGLPEITEAENKHCVTWAKPGTSLHEKGDALDIYPLDGGKLAGADSALWGRLGAFGEAVGFDWGGRWKRKDLPHFQINRKG